MELDVDLGIDSYFEARPMPKIVHPSVRIRSGVEEKGIKAQPTSKYYHLRSLDNNFRKLSNSGSPSPHRKSMPSRPQRVNLEDNIELKRGSVYQSSREVRNMRMLNQGRGKESTYSDEGFISFDIVESASHRSREDSVLVSQQLTHQNDAILFSKQKTRSPLGSLREEPKSPSRGTINLIPKKSLEFLELSFRDLPENQPNLNSSQYKVAECSSAGAASPMLEKGSIEEAKSDCNKMLVPVNHGNILHRRESIHTLPKSFSEKPGMLNTHFQADIDILKASSKDRFSPLKWMLDPIMKSKSQRNPSLTKAETAGCTATDASSVRRNGDFCESSLTEFSKVAQESGNNQVFTAQSSPAHLHAILKLEFKHGAPSFEFSVNDREDVLYAKTWKTDSAFNWVYTFHSCKRKSKNSSRGTKGRHGPSSSSPVVGQMQVSCYLCSEMSENRSLDNYMATEFILYDIAQGRRSYAVEERSHCCSDSIQPSTITDSEGLFTGNSSELNGSTEPQRNQHTFRRNSTDWDSDPSTCYPWSAEDLHPHFETAAIVIHIPFKKEKVKDSQMEEMRVNGKSNLSSASAFGYGGDIKYNTMAPAIMKVVTPSGNHGLPNSDEGSPSSLLDRWRFGGGCDCGGWDMSCPIYVFQNICSVDLVNFSTKERQQPIVLLVQGRKEKVPALTIRAEGKGQYAVDFHGQLSALQAFSICVAILHGSGVSSAFGQERGHGHWPCMNPLKLLHKEELRHLIEAVAVKEMREAKKAEVPPSFFLDRPFSPIGRV